MGSQQLMIITLVVFVAGLAIWGGIRMVRAYNQSNERDLVLHQMSVLVGEAKKYHAKPKSIGGGEGSYVGFEPASGFAVTDRLRVYTTSGADWLLFQGFGTVEGWDATTPVQVVAQYNQDIQDFSTITNVN